jgi:hypothetical protein
MKKELIKITKSELQKAGEIPLTKEQLNLILKPTPKKYIKERPAKGGGKWRYVKTGYVQKVLNLLTGWQWSFEVMDKIINLEAGQCIVQGRLTFKINGETFFKEQFGRADIKYFTSTKNPIDLGNDLKAAASDALKKCASMIGIAADVYSPDDYSPVEVVDEREELKPGMEEWEIAVERKYSLPQLEKEFFISEKNKELYLSLINKK